MKKKTWQTIDSAPRDMTIILVKLKEHQTIVLAKWFDCYQQWQTNCGYFIRDDEIESWISMPKYPKLWTIMN